MKIMNRRSALLGVAALAFAPQAFAQATPAQVTPALLQGSARVQAISQANTVLNGVQRLQGRFVQQSPGGQRAGGMFYMQRPGKLRFQYDPPATMLIVSDGSMVAMRDTALRTTERTPLASTPLNIILRRSVNLERDARVLRVSRAGPWLMLTMRDRSGQTDGQITLQFYGDQAELRSWDVIDATGARTRISLSDVTQPSALDPALFQLPDVVPGNRHRPH